MRLCKLGIICAITVFICTVNINYAYGDEHFISKSFPPENIIKANVERMKNKNDTIDSSKYIYHKGIGKYNKEANVYVLYYTYGIRNKWGFSDGGGVDKEIIVHLDTNKWLILSGLENIWIMENTEPPKLKYRPLDNNIPPPAPPPSNKKGPAPPAPPPPKPAAPAPPADPR